MTYDLQLQINGNPTISEINSNKDNRDLLGKSNKQNEPIKNGQLNTNLSLSSYNKQIKQNKTATNVSKAIKNVN
jgi:hypothetical protein